MRDQRSSNGFDSLVPLPQTSARCARWAGIVPGRIDLLVLRTLPAETNHLRRWELAGAAVVEAREDCCDVVGDVDRPDLVPHPRATDFRKRASPSFRSCRLQLLDRWPPSHRTSVCRDELNRLKLCAEEVCPGLRQATEGKALLGSSESSRSALPET